jgi:RNA polymerase sigma-70 factor (ECF subfamily)
VVTQKKEIAMESLSDLELVKALKRGEESAFQELIQRYAAKAFSLARRILKNQEDAEEALQDVFITVYKRIERFEERSFFSSWLYRITVNASLMLLRKKRSSRVCLLNDLNDEIREHSHQSEAEPNWADRRAESSQLGRRIREGLKALPIEYSQVFILKDIDGLSCLEVSRALKISLPAVKSRLHRARMMLRRELSAIYSEYRQVKDLAYRC